MDGNLAMANQLENNQDNPNFSYPYCPACHGCGEEQPDQKCLNCDGSGHLKPSYEFLHPRYKQPKRYPQTHHITRLSDHILNVLTEPMTEDDIKFALNTRESLKDSLRRLEKRGRVKLVGEEWVKIT